MESSYVDSNAEEDEQPLEVFRSRSKTWPIKEPEFTYSSSGINSSSLLSSRLPSINILNDSPWSQNGSDQYTNSPSFYSTHDNNSNQSLDKEPNAIGPEKPKRTRRRNTDSNAQKKINPWGESSYADLIIRALETAPDGRLRLNEIYTWFTENVPYFQSRSLPEESAGWKVQNCKFSKFINTINFNIL